MQAVRDPSRTNPKGIPPHSPGLQSYPGLYAVKPHNPNGVASQFNVWDVVDLHP